MLHSNNFTSLTKRPSHGGIFHLHVLTKFLKEKIDVHKLGADFSPCTALHSLYKILHYERRSANPPSIFKYCEVGAYNVCGCEPENWNPYIESAEIEILIFRVKRFKPTT